ncbi:uncharacterized protein LOC111692101 [Anoplophora glabripennis]|uniref:uncharacterized protein LOC111692101 n=1 Tax=Anoplophora glabripennis TaxID=217634 RepID=UPI000C75A2FE|nr:uncharacterized protein LOC111692101 [Anoplophora glabripennis]
MAVYACIRWGLKSEYYLTFLILYYDRVISTSLMYNIVDLLRNKYKQINKILVDINRSTVIKKNTFNRIRDVKREYTETVMVVEIWNKIFGWPLLLIFVEILARVLLSLAALTEHGIDGLMGSRNHFGPVSIVFCCEATSHEAVKLLKVCYNLQEAYSLLPKERDELNRLQDLIQNKNPTFMAANFFEIKRSLLLSLISTTTTYMIVILQFNFNVSYLSNRTR